MFCKSLELDESVFAELISRQNHFSVLAHPVFFFPPQSSAVCLHGGSSSAGWPSWGEHTVLMLFEH